MLTTEVRRVSSEKKKRVSSTQNGGGREGAREGARPDAPPPTATRRIPAHDPHTTPHTIIICTSFSNNITSYYHSRQSPTPLRKLNTAK